MKHKPESHPVDVDSSDSEAAPGAAQDAPLAELALEKDRYLRLAADFDNFRKRTARDSEQRANAQKESFIRELLPIVDNFERALASDTSAAEGKIRQGLEMILQQLVDLLKRHGIESENPLGKTFNAQRHEALGARFDAAQSDDTVLEVVQRGYRRGDDVLRPAQVIINDHNLKSTHRHGR